MPEHLLAGVKGPSTVIAGALFCYGVGNDLPGRAQNGTGLVAEVSFCWLAEKFVRVTSYAVCS
jgi:hypothetical protein